MADSFAVVFDTLTGVLRRHVELLTVQADTVSEYTLHTRTPSPFPQHKGKPMFFAQVRKGKAYVSFHLMPLYMNEKLSATVSPELKKRMQGKTCFNFKSGPDPELLRELERLTEAGLACFAERKWL